MERKPALNMDCGPHNFSEHFATLTGMLEGRRPLKIGNDFIGDWIISSNRILSLTRSVLYVLKGNKEKNVKQNPV